MRSLLRKAAVAVPVLASAVVVATPLIAAASQNFR